MDKSIEEQIEKLNIISPIKAIVSNQENELGNGNVVTKEKIKLEKDGQIVEADVVISFVAGEARKPFVAYTFDNVDEKSDDYKAIVDINEVVFTEEGYYLAAPSQEDHKNIVVPAIVAIGNSDSDSEQVEENVREAINDPNFEIISLNTVEEYLVEYEEEYEATEEKENIFFKVKSAISVLIPIAKLKIIKNHYIKQVNKMYKKSYLDFHKNLNLDEIDIELRKNDVQYSKVTSLKRQFEDLPNNEDYKKDIKKLEELQEKLDTARYIYLEKEDEALENEVLNPVEENEEELEEVVTEEPITLEPTVNETEEIVDEKEETPIMNEIVDKNEGIEKLADEVVAEQEKELVIKEEEDELKALVDVKVQDFNKEIEDFKKAQLERYTEKYNREQETLIKSLRSTYEEYIRNLRTKLTETLDKCMLEANNSINELKNVNDGLKTALATSEKNLKEEKNDNASLRNAINEKDKEISGLKVKEQEYDKKDDEQKVELASLKKDNQEKDVKINSLESEVRKEKANNETLNVELKAKDSKINELSANLTKTEEANADYKNQLETMSKNMDDLRRNSEDYRISTQKEIEMLKAQLSNYQTFMSNMRKLQESTNEIADSYGIKEEGKSK